MALDLTGVAAGGEAVGRDAAGRVVFVGGALPGERVAVEITEEKARFARGRVVEVLAPAAQRRPEPCPHVARGCGGCDWQHAPEDVQRDLRAQIVSDALVRLGGLSDPRIEAGPPLPATAARTTVRAAVEGGSAGFHRRHSDEIVTVDSCLVTHPLVEDLLAEGDFGEASEVTVRAGARTGERLILVRPTAIGVCVPDDVVLVGADELVGGRRAWFHEEAAGRRWRISAGSFFQASPEGAEALVATVRDAIAVGPDGGGPLVDLCAGVGLFAATVGDDRPVVAVERSASAVADARVNLAGTSARVVRVALERWRPRPAEIVVADPARAGLGRTGVGRAVATRADTIVLVSCDPAALGRDARLLGEQGYGHERSVMVDLFPQTSHVEVVSTFRRAGS